ncbi:MAG: hypothetical protein ACRD1P_09770 [Thermoanaerobaculia bacterium]
MCVAHAKVAPAHKRPARRGTFARGLPTVRNRDEDYQDYPRPDPRAIMGTGGGGKSLCLPIHCALLSHQYSG